jgi:hypothetical protein
LPGEEAPAEDAANDTLEPAVAPTLEVEPAKTAEEAPPAPDLTPQLEAKDKEIAELNQKLEAAEESARNAQNAGDGESAELQKSLDAKTKEIGQLNDQVADLEKQLADAKAAVEAAQAAAETAKQEAVESIKAAPKEPAPVAEAPKEEPAPVKAAEAPVKPKPIQAATAKTESSAPLAKVMSWEMKAAQPGKAVLSSKSTGDTRNVEVGDTVEGLGKITMIAKENGHWTVKGTKGSVIR